MVVVPALAHTQQANDPLVMARVIGLKFALPKCMTDRVHAPGDMVSQENAYQSTPEESTPAANRKGDKQREHNPEQECAAHKHDLPIFQQMFAIYFRGCLSVFKEPANVRVKKSLNRAMRITLFVRMGMVFYMRCCPLNCRPFQGHRSKHKKNEFNDWMRIEATMGQHPMIANGDSQGNQYIHTYE